MLDKIKKIDGVVMAIGLDMKKQKALENNNNISECYLLNCDSASSSKTYKSYTKTINIKNLKKIFHKKSIDYIICNFEQVKPHLRTFIKNSIYLNKNIIYFYNLNDYDLEQLKKRYERYNTTFDIKKNYIIIDTKNTKASFFKNIYFYLCDLIYDIIDYIGKLLVN